MNLTAMLNVKIKADDIEARVKPFRFDFCHSPSACKLVNNWHITYNKSQSMCSLLLFPWTNCSLAMGTKPWCDDTQGTAWPLSPIDWCFPGSSELWPLDDIPGIPPHNAEHNTFSPGHIGKQVEVFIVPPQLCMVKVHVEMVDINRVDNSIWIKWQRQSQAKLLMLESEGSKKCPSSGNRSACASWKIGSSMFRSGGDYFHSPSTRFPESWSGVSHSRSSDSISQSGAPGHCGVRHSQSFDASSLSGGPGHSSPRLLACVW